MNNPNITNQQPKVRESLRTHNLNQRIVIDHLLKTAPTTPILGQSSEAQIPPINIATAMKDFSSTVHPHVVKPRKENDLLKGGPTLEYSKISTESTGVNSNSNNPYSQNTNNPALDKRISTQQELFKTIYDNDKFCQQSEKLIMTSKSYENSPPALLNRIQPANSLSNSFKKSPAGALLKKMKNRAIEDGRLGFPNNYVDINKKCGKNIFQELSIGGDKNYSSNPTSGPEKIRKEVNRKADNSTSINNFNPRRDYNWINNSENAATGQNLRTEYYLNENQIYSCGLKEENICNEVPDLGENISDLKLNGELLRILDSFTTRYNKMEYFSSYSYEEILKQVQVAHDEKDKLALVQKKLSDFINSARISLRVKEKERQYSYSYQNISESTPERRTSEEFYVTRGELTENSISAPKKNKNMVIVSPRIGTPRKKMSHISILNKVQ
jgi:hypothetical protein